MTRFGLVMRNLVRFWRPNLALLAGMAVATAVLGGALLVGDSVRGSLTQMAEERLGPVDHALFSTAFFDASLSRRLAEQPEFNKRFTAAVSGVMIRGGAGREGAQERVGGVQIAALEDSPWLSVKKGAGKVNGELARSLGLGAAGGNVRLYLPILNDALADSTLAQRSRDQTTSALGAAATRVEESSFLSTFTLFPSQRLSRNAWVDLADLQDAVDQPGRANVLLVSARERGDAGNNAALNGLLAQVAKLDDFGLTVSAARDGFVTVTSRATFILPPALAAVDAAAAKAGAPLQHAMVYLVNNLSAPSGKAVHYIVAAGIDAIDGAALQEDEIVLNEWAMQQLGVKVGDALSMRYYARQPDGTLADVDAGVRFRVAKALPMSGLGADPDLTPYYKGLTDADKISAWKAPAGLKIDQSLVTPEDEKYWAEHHAAPKAFVSLATARRLWGGAFGDVTTVRLPADKAEAFTAALGATPAANLGLEFKDVRAEQLASAKNGSDFAELFISFSFFILVAAGLLIAMLFRLGVEQRARQLGMMGAIGFSPSALRRLALAEGAVLAAAGSALGMALALAYTAFILHGLRTWWNDAVGTAQISLHASAESLAYGFLGSFLLAMAAVWWAARRISKVASAALLAGAWNVAGVRRRSRALPLVIAAGALAAGAGLLGAGIAKALAQEIAFFTGGFLILVGALALVWTRFTRAAGASAAEGAAAVRTPSIFRVAMGNAARNPARSMLCAALVAFASFLLVVISLFHQEAQAGAAPAGAGGFSMILQSDVPLLGDLSNKAGRNLLGMNDVDNPLYARATLVPMRLWAGQDVSCLNLTRPDRPTVLSAPAALTRLNRFEFAGVDESLNPTDAERKNPWLLLSRTLDSGEIPVAADNETALYILKVGIGKALPLTDALGRRQSLRLVATLKDSIFQSELLMGEAHFVKLFPAQAGAGVVLIDAPPADAEKLKALFYDELEDYSITIDSTAARLNRYHQVANTYLSTFQALGFLGLMLGTVGLAVVLLRNLVERRSELALLAAIGFAPGQRRRIILLESAMLLLVGLGVGVVSAGLAIAPVVFTQSRALDLPRLGAALGLVLVVGLAAQWLAVGKVGARFRLADLRGM